MKPRPRFHIHGDSTAVSCKNLPSKAYGLLRKFPCSSRDVLEATADVGTRKGRQPTIFPPTEERPVSTPRIPGCDGLLRIAGTGVDSCKSSSVDVTLLVPPGEQGGSVLNLAQRFEKHVHSGDVHPSIINGVQALMSGTLTDWAAKRLWRALCPRSSFPDALFPDHASIRLHCVHAPPHLPQPLSHYSDDFCSGRWPLGSVRERKRLRGGG